MNCQADRVNIMTACCTSDFDSVRITRERSAFYRQFPLLSDLFNESRQGTRCSSRGNGRRFMPLHHTLAFGGNLYILKIALVHGTDVNDADYYNITPLHIAATYCTDIEIFKLLLKRGANINAKNFYEITPLHMAVSNDNIGEDIIQLLIDNGADVTALDLSRNSVLKYALKNSAISLTTIKRLLESGARPSYYDVQREERSDYVKLLIPFIILHNFESCFWSLKEFSLRTFPFGLEASKFLKTNYTMCYAFGDAHVKELVEMKKCNIGQTCTLYKFLYEICCRGMRNYVVNLSTIKEVLVKIRYGNQNYYKQFLLTSLKKCSRDSLLQISQLDIYTASTPEHVSISKISLNYYAKLKLVSYLSTDDLVNLGLSFITCPEHQFQSNVTNIDIKPIKRPIEFRDKPIFKRPRK